MGDIIMAVNERKHRVKRRGRDNGSAGWLLYIRTVSFLVAKLQRLGKLWSRYLRLTSQIHRTLYSC